MTEFINKEALNRYNDKDFIIFDRSKVRKGDRVLVGGYKYYIVAKYYGYKKNLDFYYLELKGDIMLLKFIYYIDSRNIFKRLLDKITGKYF